jgi:hypothetical protein
MGNINLFTNGFNPDHASTVHFTESDKVNKLPNIKKSLKIYHQNICGVRYKINELLSLLYPDFPHILCIIEHHLSYTELSTIVSGNYKLGAFYCRKNCI